MKTLSLFFLLVAFGPNEPVSPTDLIEVRKSYYLAIESEKHLDSFEAALTGFDNPNKTILGYIGMYFMLKAKYAWLPNYKIEYFTKGKDMLESAISSDPSNIELKFMRFCTQNNTPGFLNYSSNLASDKSDLINSFPLIKDSDLKKRILDYMLKEKIKLTAKDLETLKQ